eukprot:CAMPEP_0197836210 /NCGR_PEP_ID=MMETSP1437-20131217/28268_1 /TAXON_ID=49252 ORGANISM="Eucampia antarctica, Strain CCMP1452" /NCGR_SAMPLE_ID=MMETSP1437 /ASSEMBLY_ACC=CAM_ASM_001096 /LENGTH=689 /DNA_ID=CAMNT_0043442213 /DNA_START=55 /DNA_END=2124 /DNA_ORIENTATION=+
MGRKKSRNTAKTGDKALYKNRDEATLDTSANKGSDDDNMYDEVDRFHNGREEEQIMRFDKNEGDSESEDDGITKDREAVFDLGVGGSSSEEDESDEDSSDDNSSSADEEEEVMQSDEDDDDSDSDGSEEEDPTKTNVLDWGRKKRDYYLGDTADLEIGQDEEDAEVEEEAGREVVRARLEKMEEDDFMLDEDDNDDDKVVRSQSKTSKKTTGKSNSSSTTAIETIQSSKTREKLQQLSTKEKIKLLKFSHPELLPIVEHFRDASIQNLLKETLIATNALTKDEDNAQAVGATSDGLLYLLSKAMLQTSTALNVCQYLLLKAEQASAESSNSDSFDALNTNEDEDDSADVKNHPVIGRLNQCNDLAERLSDRVEKQLPSLNNQIQSLVKAAALMEDGDSDSSDDGHSEGEETDSSELNDSDDDMDDEEGALKLMKSKSMKKKIASDDESSSSEEDEDVVRGRVMTEARFAHRPQEDTIKSNSKSKRRPAPFGADFGDVEEDDEAAIASGKSLAIKLNTISQKSKSNNKKNSTAPEDQDDADDEKFRRAIEMMEEEYGAESDEEKEDDNDIEMDEPTGDDFYNKIKQKSMAKKDSKKKQYAVAPKYPSYEGEIEGERSIGNQILRNRGLVAHKNKLNRNPRVKKREQYRKALIRRKGAIREVRTDEADKYGGEGTGIKSRLSRSRKLGVPN